MESVSGEDLILPDSPLYWTMVSMDLWRWKEDRKEPTIITDGNPPSNPSHISHKGYYSFLLPWLYFNVLQAKVLLGQRKETRPELSSDSVEPPIYLHDRDTSLVSDVCLCLSDILGSRFFLLEFVEVAISIARLTLCLCKQ